MCRSDHVVRRWAEPVDPRSNLLIQVPGGYNQNQEKWDGPSGVLVCSEDYITYKHQDQPEHRVPIPKRLNPIERPNERRGTLIVASVLHKMKNAFFFLVQTEDGDLFKITMEHQDDEIRSLKIKYFDTVPVASGLAILRSGFLFVASEYGPQLLYSFQKLGDDDDLPEYISTDYDENGAGRRRPQLPTFTPRPLDNLVQVDEVPSLEPILDAKPLNPLASDSPQIFAACGRGARSSLKMLRHGLEAQEAVSSDLPGVPSAVWTTKITRQDEYDSYIILSFVAIGRELENPFGDDVNDLPLDTYCKQVATEMDIITATPPARMDDIMSSSDNLVLYPLSLDGYDKWKDRSVSDIRAALRAKVVAQKTQGNMSDSALIVTEEDATAY